MKLSNRRGWVVLLALGAAPLGCPYNYADLTEPRTREGGGAGAGGAAEGNAGTGAGSGGTGSGGLGSGGNAGSAGSAAGCMGCSGVVEWGKTFGDATEQIGTGVATDAFGSVFVTGYYSGSIDFGAGPLGDPGPVDYDVFVAKLSAQGLPLWSKGFGQGSGQKSSALATDASGNVVVIGDYTGPIDFGGGPLQAIGGQYLFVVKLDGSGNHIWSRRFRDSNDQHANSIAIDGSGSLLVTGSFVDPIDFGGGPLTRMGTESIFVAKLDDGGNHLWSKRFGDDARQVASGIATDSGGNVVLTGAFAGGLDFGGGALANAGGSDIFVAKLDASGNHLWSKHFGGPGDEIATSLAIDGDGNVLLTGYFDDTIDFGGGSLTSAGGQDIFVVKLDSSGNHLWSKRFGDASPQSGESVTVDATGNVIFTGYMYGEADFGGGPLQSNGGDVFLAKLTAAGEHVWSKRFGDASGQMGRGVTTDKANNVILVGETAGGIDFGTGLLPNGGEFDVLVAKFEP